MIEPLGIMPRQSDTRLGVDNHALRAKAKRLRDVLQRLVAAIESGGAVPPELLSEARANAQASDSFDVLDSLY